MNAKHVAELLAQYRASKENDRHADRVHVGNELMDIGDALAKELVCGVENLNQLLAKWAAHGYRPTLRPDPNEPKIEMLADIYDLCAEARGMRARAYRG